jgi:hypothetical protein
MTMTMTMTPALAMRLTTMRTRHNNAMTEPFALHTNRKKWKTTA